MIKLILLILPMNLFANYAEYFGTSASTQAIANQATGEAFDPSNNYYVPAVLAFSKKLHFSAYAGSVMPNFEDINSIVTKNTSTSSTTETGNANTDYDSTFHSSLHLSLPIAHEGAGNVGVSIFMPVGSIMETNSGHPYLPEYVMYQARYNRTVAHVNYAHPLSDSLAFSVGAHIGFQASADANTQASLNGTSYGSSANAKTKVSPSLAAILSIYKKFQADDIYFTFQQEMKSNLDANASGEINDPTSLLFDITLKTMIYYDPHIFRFGWIKNWGSLKTLLSLEYQLWDNYKTPVVRIIDNGGVLLPSNDYETLKTRNIFYPKLGLIFDLTDSVNLLAGLAYRQSPIDSDFSGNGNSVDSDSYIASTGLGYKTRFLEKEVELGLSFQYHQLKDETVTKNSGQENGSAGQKIGAPGYKIGGSILTGKIGGRISF